MATAQYGTLIAALGSPNGQRKFFRVYFSDAAGAATFASGASSAILHGTKDTYIVDLQTPTALATMVSISVYTGGVPEGSVVSVGALASTVIGRAFQQAPVRVPAGKELALIQA